MTKWTKKSAFWAYKTRQTNDRWGWSGIADDRSVVAVTIWKDLVHYNDKGEPFYDGFEEKQESIIHLWGNRPGNEDRKKHLRHALDHLDGYVRVVMTVAVDPEAEPREIKDVYPWGKLWFKIVRFDEDTGQFSLEFSHSD